jgi:beta-glucosidase-like glycosyl hydrolase
MYATTVPFNKLRVETSRGSANSKYLNDTLRNSWGFDGYVTSDCQ